MPQLTDIIEDLLALIPSEYQITIDKIRKIIIYLRKYGYLHRLNEIHLADIVSAVRLFQEYAGLSPDGVIKPDVLDAINQPRCQLQDVVTGEQATETLKWGNNTLRYYLARRDAELSSEQWAGAIATAFKYWSDVADVKFERVNSQSEANLIISTGSSSRDGFDGPSGTLAWAQMPVGNNYSGQLVCKFDSSENWILPNSSERGILLVNVACHEFGHLLGLLHSKVNTALMAPFYSYKVDKPQEIDDISRIQALYGKSIDVPTPPPPPPPPSGDQELNIRIVGNIKSIDIPGYIITKRE